MNDRIAQLRQWWRENPDNPDNMDRERFNSKRINNLQWTAAFGLFWAIITTVYMYVLELRPTAQPFTFQMPLAFVCLIGLMFFLDWRIGRECPDPATAEAVE